MGKKKSKKPLDCGNPLDFKSNGCKTFQGATNKALTGDGRKKFKI